MKKRIIKISIITLTLAMLAMVLYQNNMMEVQATMEMNSRATVLIERNSGKILCSKAENERFPIASVTKLMTTLLVLEDLESGKLTLDDAVLVSENANGMGGSQIFLDANVEYKLGDLLKSVIVASANDSSVALAEHIAGSENNFVKRMNERARELNMNNTNYSNCTGLPTNDGYSSAYDQAILLNKVLNYEIYHEFSSIWNEDFVHPSGRKTVMTNTNKLTRFYSGCIGGKTGSTNQAKYCLAVGAKRGETELVAVVLGAENSKDRFAIASELLNHGFENFTSKTLFDDNNLKDMTISIKGQNRVVHLKCARPYVEVVENGKEINFSLNYNLPTMLRSVEENQVVGNVEIIIDGVVVDRIDILSSETQKEATFFDYLKEITQ